MKKQNESTRKIGEYERMAILKEHLEVHDQFFEEIGNIEHKLQHMLFKIRDLLGRYKENRLEFDTEYQRTEVWTMKKKRLLIDSILRKYDISMIFLRQRICDDRLHYECIDGQQRLKCVFRFIDNQFDITPDVTPGLDHKYFYRELPKDCRYDIQMFEVNSIVVSDADDYTTTDIFMRLQEGVRLNHAEQLNAEQSKMRSAAIEISKHPFFFRYVTQEY